MTRDEPTAGTGRLDSLFNAEWSQNWSYGGKGIEYNPADSDTALWIGLRFQTRYDTRPGDLRTPADLISSGDQGFDLRRGRIKGGGDLFRDWLHVYLEHDFASDTFLDYRVTTTWRGFLSFRIGQWKSEFNRERVDSSGRQQLVERSITNYWFTVDRQRGIATSARFARGTIADTRVYLERLSGLGLGNNFESDAGLWLGRVMWNPSGTQLPYSQSALVRHDKPVSSIAVAMIDGRSPHTSFSSSGGGNLPGFTTGDFDLRQYLFETAVHYRGFAWQQELHVKRIRDRESGLEREIAGGYAQLGVFMDQLTEFWSPNVEVVGRFAIVDPDRDRASDTQTEWTLGLNWFFHGHRNKLTADYSWLDFDDPLAGESGNRFRLQWELSL